MAGSTKLLTSSGGGVILTPASNIASDVTVSLPTTTCTLVGGVNGIAPESSGGTGTTTGYYGFKNRIINGSFQIWQRGTSFTSSAINEYSVDRWRTEGFAVSGGTVISQQTFTAGQTAVPGFPTYYCQIQTNGAIASGQYWAFQQRIESPQNLSGYETVTLSFWAKVPSGTLAAGAFQYGIITTAFVNSPALTTTWQKITLTQTLTAGSGSGYVSVYPVYLPALTAALTVQIANVQVEVGATATSFDYRPYGTELALCQRYYQQTFAAWGSWSATNTASAQVPTPVTFRVSPSVSYTGTVNGQSPSVNTWTSTTQPSSVNGFGFNPNYVFFTVTGFGGNGTFNTTAVMYSVTFQMTAEL